MNRSRQPVSRSTTASSSSYAPTSFYEAEVMASRSVDIDKMSYEQLQDLCDKIGTVKAGISKETYSRLPTRILTNKKDQNQNNNNNATSTSSSSSSTTTTSTKPKPEDACCICMNALLEESSEEQQQSRKKKSSIVSSKVKCLPCKHNFHASCIKEWLSSHKTCPVCKSDVSKSAASVGSLLCQLL